MQQGLYLCYNIIMSKKKKNKNLNIVLYYSFGAILIIIGAWLIINELVIFPGEYVSPPKLVTKPPESVDQTPNGSHSGSIDETPMPAADPVRIYFPRFKIQSDIEPVGLTSTGAMGTVNAHDIAAWYKDGPIPGESGNSLINGHVRYSGKKGYFAILRDFEVGDEVIVELADGSYRYFRVESVNFYPYNDFPDDVLSLGGETRLTLITCGGDFDHDIGTSRTRVVAVCKPVG